MQNFYKLIVLIFTVVLTLTVHSNVHAIEKSPTYIGTDENSFALTSTHGDTFIAGSKLRIDTEVNGDFFAAAEYIEINKPINGSLYVLARELEINSNVKGDVHAIVQRLSVNAPVNGSIRTLSESLEIRSQIYRSMQFLAENVYIPATGEIENDLYGLAHKFHFEGKVGKNLNIYGTEGSDIFINGKVGGNLYYSGTRPDISNTAYIDGKIIKEPFNLEQQAQTSNKTNKTMLIANTILYMLFVFALGLLLIRFQGGRLEKLVQKIRTDNISLLPTGLLAMLLIMLSIVVLFITLIGIPYSLSIIVTLFILNHTLVPVVGGLLVGHYILPQKGKPYKLLIGVIILTTLSLYSILDTLINLTLFLLIAGAIYRLKKGK